MKYVIAGFGQFGRLALDRLLKRDKDVSVVIVEQDQGKLRNDFPITISTVVRDARDFLRDDPSLSEDDVVVPMVPFHLAAQYALQVTPGASLSILPDRLLESLPNPVRIDDANVCCTRAAFMCPDDCPEGDLCTVTGEPRSPLWEYLEGFQSPEFSMAVVRSFQILPGVGGYAMQDLRHLSRGLKPGLNIVVTSCKCHGFVTAIRIDAHGRRENSVSITR